MAYANFDYYRSVYFGDIVPEHQFQKLSDRASEYIDYVTSGNAINNADDPAIKKACCALAEVYAAVEKAKSAGASERAEVKAESVGSWSQTYQTSAEAATDASRKLYKTATQYLLRTGMMHRGAAMYE